MDHGLLTGDGVFPTTTVRPTTASLTFGDQRRGTTSGTQLLTLENTGTDTLHLAPGTAAVWKYRAIYLNGDEQFGQWSDPVSIAVQG